MVYLKNLNGQVKEYKDSDMKTIDSLLGSGRWTRVRGLKDWSAYVKPKKSKAKKTKTSDK